MKEGETQTGRERDRSGKREEREAIRIKNRL